MHSDFFLYYVNITLIFFYYISVNILQVFSFFVLTFVNEKGKQQTMLALAALPLRLGGKKVVASAGQFDGVLKANS